MQLQELIPSNDGGELRSIGKLEPAFDSRARAITQAAIAIAVVLLAFWVAREFLVALTWAALIAITTWPVYISFRAADLRPSCVVVSSVAFYAPDRSCSACARDFGGASDCTGKRRLPTRAQPPA